MRPNQSMLSESNKSAQTDLLTRCPNTLQNFALADDPTRGIIQTMVSNFLIGLSIRNEISTISLCTTEELSQTLKKRLIKSRECFDNRLI